MLRGARKKIGALAAVAVVTFMLGCGDSDETSESLTKKEFVTQANGICDKGRKEKDRLIQGSFKDLKADPSNEELENLVLNVLPPLEEAIQDLGELAPPDGDEETVDALIGEYEEALQKAKDEPAKVVREDPFDAPDEAAQNYGLTSCSL